MRQHTPVNFAAVKIDGPFWRERLETLARRTIPSQYKHLEEQGLAALLAGNNSDAAQNGAAGKFSDAEYAKWMEAAAASLAFQHNRITEEWIDGIATAIAAVQLPDGYANTWFIANAPDKRWSNVRDDRELSSAGHLIEAAVTRFQATGDRRLMDIVLKFVDHIEATFGRGEEQKRGYCGYPEIELALLRLYAISKEAKHRDLATYFIDERGRQPHYFDMEAVARGDETTEYVGRTYEYTLSHRRVRAQESAIGHVARAMNLYAAMSELAAVQNDQSLKRTVDGLWQDVTGKRMYVTGGVGCGERETFPAPFELPEETAAATTSAAVGMIKWARRLLSNELDGTVADTLELALYNGALAALAFDGEHYFHRSRLMSNGGAARWSWGEHAEAATDIARLLAAVGGYFYSTGDDRLAVHLYGGASATVSIGGRAVSIRETSTYPWSGKITLTIDPLAAEEFVLRVRIPAFATAARARINGAAIDVGDNLVRGYLELRRTWQPGDTLELDLPMAIERVYANPAVAAEAGRVALKRGPLVYCFEQADNIAGPVSRIRLPRSAPLVTAERPDLFGGIIAIRAEGLAVDGDDWQGALYRAEPPRTRPVTWTAIPYYLWANREPGAMRVWVQED